jgi:hypothetical protein
VKKPASISKRPTAAIAPGADTWIAAGAEQPAVPAAKVKSNNPRRLTIDMTDELHKAIKLASIENGSTMIELVRNVLAAHFIKD